MIIYLASPYTHPEPEVREERFRTVCLEAGRLMREGKCIYAPIAHSHPIAKITGLPTDYGYWDNYCKKFLAVCDELWVLQMPGWDTSVGVRAEIEFAQLLNMPIRYISFNDPSSHR